MTTAAARDQGLRRVSGLTVWMAAGAVAVTGVFAGFAAQPTHTTGATTSGLVSAGSSAALTTTGGQLAANQAPSTSALPSHVRSGSS